MNVDFVLFFRRKAKHIADAVKSANFGEDRLLLFEGGRKESEPEVEATLALVVMSGAGVTINVESDVFKERGVNGESDEDAAIAEFRGIEESANSAKKARRL